MAIKMKHDESAHAAPSTETVALPVADHGARIAKETITQTVAGIETTQARIQEGMSKAMKTAEQVVAFSQGNVEALVKASQIWAAGVQDIGKQVAASNQARFEGALSAVKAIAGARTVKDAIDAQTALARSTLENSLAESGRLAESSIRLTEQALAPVAARVSLAVEMMGRPA